MRIEEGEKGMRKQEDGGLIEKDMVMRMKKGGDRRIEERERLTKTGRESNLNYHRKEIDRLGLTDNWQING